MADPELTRQSEGAGAVRRASISPETPTDRSRSALSPDLQTLLSGTLRYLAERTASTRACAWAVRPDGRTFVVAASYRETPTPEDPDEASLEALRVVWKSAAPVDLGAEGARSPLGELAARHGFSSAAPIVSNKNEPLAMLFLGGEDDPPGRVRPRTLAALDAALQRLHGPVMAAAALERLNHLDDDVCRLDRLATLGNLLSEVAHEIRNPLVSVKTFLELLPDNLDDPEFHGTFRTLVSGEVQRLERLLDAVLEHARPSSGAATAGSSTDGARIDEGFASMLRLLEQRAAEQWVKLSTEIDAGLPGLAIDEDALRQVLLNLLLNALEAAPERSVVWLRARPSACGAGQVELSVEDAGPGVSPEHRDAIFEPFYSTRSGRSGGLGLAISKKLVEEAGGSIRVEAGAEGGARFCIAIPTAEVETLPTPG
jgi:signal transduction histidine kinase